MKTSAIVCAVLAGTLGFSGLASAQSWGDRNGTRYVQADPRDNRSDVIRSYGYDPAERGARHRSTDPRDNRNDVRRSHRDGRDAYQPRYSYGDGYSYGYGQPTYRNHAPRFHRGGYLPYEYRNRGYYVSNWNAYPGLYAPPYGHQWVNVDGEFLLVALATGLIANALLN